jgi:hypothetical protein
MTTPRRMPTLLTCKVPVADEGVGVGGVAVGEGEAKQPVDDGAQERVQDVLEVRVQRRISWGIHGLPEVSLGPTLPYHTLPCRQPSLKQQ